jgi:hypothetical protein
MVDKSNGMGRLVDGLRHIADRANLPFDQVAAEISLLSQPGRREDPYHQKCTGRGLWRYPNALLGFIA